MKRKVFSIFFALVLVLSFSLVAVPVGANPGVEITSPNVTGPYSVGVEQGFSITTTSDTQYSLVRFKFVVADAVVNNITSFKYFDATTEGWVFPSANPDSTATDTWKPLGLIQSGSDLVGYFGPSTGFTMPAGYDVTTLFKINFATPKTYPVTVSLVGLPETIHTSVNFSVNVLATAPNSVASSTMIFEGALTESNGAYAGTIPMVDEVFAQLGDFVAGFDDYARNGATAAFSNSGWATPGETFLPIANHDAFPAWLTDTPDWNYYALTLDGNSWKLVYNETTPRTFETRGGVPMSGVMDWKTMYASETDLGFGFGDALCCATSNDANYGWAANNGGGAACWDIDWIPGANGSEVIPLQYAGFAVEVTGTGPYTVTLTPAAPTAVGMTASFTARLGISVTPLTVDFGSLTPGVPSDPPRKVTVTNLGNVVEDFSASIENESPAGVYTYIGDPPFGLLMGGGAVVGWTAPNVLVNSFVEPPLVLTVPTGTDPGTYTATLVFWAEQSQPQP